VEEGTKQLMVGLSHLIILAGIGQHAGRSKLGEAMGEKPRPIARIDPPAARLTGQPLGTHHRTHSVGWVEILGGHMIESINVVDGCVAKDVIRCRDAKRMGVIPGCGRRT